MATGKLTSRQSRIVGVTLFSMFFGAGNLIIPPLLGLQAGEAVVPAMVGFLVTGIGSAHARHYRGWPRGHVLHLASRVHPLFAHVFVAANLPGNGSCLAIRRTSSTSFEMFEPLLPAGLSLEVGAPRVLGSCSSPLPTCSPCIRNALTRLLGRITGPALIALLVFVIGAALFDPASSLEAAHATYASAPAMSGFLTGYQTMDLLASLTFGIVIATNIRELGVTDDLPASRARFPARAYSRACSWASILLRLGAGGRQHSRRSARRYQRCRDPCSPPLVSTSVRGGHGGRCGNLPACLPQCVHRSHQLLRHVLLPTSSRAFHIACGHWVLPCSPAWCRTSGLMPSSRSPSHCSTRCTPWRSSWL